MLGMKRIFIIGIVVLAAAILLTTTTGYRNTRPIKIGGLFPLTGGLASYGEPARNMAMLAVDEINRAGGINGTPLELVFEDHKCDPKQALSSFEKLNNLDQIKIFNAVACSGTVATIAPLLVQKDVLMVGTITTANKLSGISPNFFRNWASDQQEARLLADEILKKGYKNIIAIYEETDYAKGLVVSLEEFLEGTDVTVATESFAANSTDVRSQLTKLEARKSDLLFISVQTVTTGETVLSQMEQLQFHPKAMFVSDNILKTASLISRHSKLLDGALGADYVIPISSNLETVLTRYKDRFGSDCDPVNLCAAEYDAIQLLASILKKGGDSVAADKDYLGTESYAGISGTISFDSRHDRKDADYSLFKIVSGKAALHPGSH